MIVPHYFQSDAVDELFKFYSEPRKMVNGHLERKNALICMPTGTGKSVVIGTFIMRSFLQYDPNSRFFMCTHVKTLIEQNAVRLQQIWPAAPLGVYSAGLNKRQSLQPIIFGGIQSAVGKEVFGHRDFLIIDEAHLVSDDGSYLKFIEQLMKDNPYLKIIGLTATRYRMGLGCLTNGKIFTHIIIDYCTMEWFSRFIAEGFLCPLVPKRTKIELDVSKVAISKGEYVQGALQAAVDKTDITVAALKELVEYSAGRKSWLIFASGVEHANHIGEILETMFGVSNIVMHSEKSGKENDAALQQWKNGEVTAAVSMGMLTTGVDHPACDYIGMLRPTCSTGLWVQMLGRGTRPLYAPGYDIADISQRLRAIEEGGKKDCLVLDFARNTPRLGPINDPVIPKLKGKGPPGDAPVKICKKCGTYNHTSARECLACGQIFEQSPKINRMAGTDPLIRSDIPQVETFNVDRVVMVKHATKEIVDKSGKVLKPSRESIKICYYCAPLRTFYEWINFESTIPFVKHKANNWFRQRFPYDQYPEQPSGAVPDNNDQVLGVMSTLRPPTRIRVHVNKQHPEVMGYEF
jgi:DNA repair protein RadD